MSDHAEDEQANDTDEDVIFPEDEKTGDEPRLEAEFEPTDLEKAHAERDRMREQLLRIAADFDNFRKRSRKEIEEVRRRSTEDTLREVLPVVDNLERAAGAMTDATEVAAVTEGVHMVLRGFEDIANRLGLKRVPSVGNLFDPACHDAIQQEETNEHAPGTIMAEVVPGYYLGERLLRPAMVVVARPPTGTGNQGDVSTDGNGGPK
jgi:molecular chaperone GrpE